MTIKRARVPSQAGKRRWTEEDAAAVLDSVDASGLTLTEFANQHDLDRQRLERWRRRLGDRSPGWEAPQIAFEEVVAAPGPMPPAGRMEIVLRGGRVVRLDAAFDADALQRLLAVLEGATC